ncbi:hypothetical protein GWI33_014924 [Rhynchophorus ferrugineus]|uniref:Uncharacterized protein n=1 Tax=Rhynchophorus ferrugineus TaxID=354439 RepID=A0A834I4V5_RHYFE|nr:hypothetical protein GWI33_014924 [Rhynchophorus ferrugineus]
MAFNVRTKKNCDYKPMVHEKNEAGAYINLARDNSKKIYACSGHCGGCLRKYKQMEIPKLRSGHKYGRKPFRTRMGLAIDHNSGGYRLHDREVIV